MLPEYPNTGYQGYAVVSFDVNEMGELINIEAIESKYKDYAKKNGYFSDIYHIIILTKKRGLKALFLWKITLLQF